CGSGVLPFRKAVCEGAIRESGIAVSTNLAAFEAAYQRAQRADDDPDTVNPTASAAADATGVPAVTGATGVTTASALAPLGDETVPSRARTAQLQPLLDRVMRLPSAVQQLALHGVRRTIDYQDPAYAQLYLQRLERIVELERSHAGAAASECALTCAVARSLALWMTFEDTIRVADLKTRAARFDRVRAEIRAEPGQLFGVTEFMKPRVQEIAGTLPARIGRRVERSARLTSWLARWTGGRQIRTGTVSGFLMLHALGGLRRWRRGTLRYAEENARIEQWLTRIAALAVRRYELAVELAKAQRLVKGYGETHERGWRNFRTLLEATEPLAMRDDGAAILARLQAAALADEEGTTLARELAGLAGLGGVGGAGGGRTQEPAAAAPMAAVPR
ncbi:MAG: indolepyruvate oxidoreductase subunit beta family protein, partial [Sinobacteraceae bacterium]|nr:indolepyruvate oxidoreductase subunit beta family protein [Nevskiaceae bacterium]